MRIAAITSARLVLVGLQARLRHRRPRRVAQLGEARQLDDLPQVVEVEQAVDVEDLGAPRRRAPGELLAQVAGPCPAPTSTRTTSPKRRRRSSSSTACEQVVGLVGDLKSASRVTRKMPWSTISMPGNSASRCVAMRSSSGTKRAPVAVDGTKRGSISFGTFTRAKVSCAVDRVAHEHGERQRQVRDVRERAARARPPAASAPGRSGGGSARRARARSSAATSSSRRCGCRARPAPGAARRSTQRVRRSMLLDGRARGSRRSSRAACGRRRSGVVDRRRRPGRAGRRRGP